MTTESLGISVPIPGKKTIFYRKEVLFGGFHAACSVARFRFRYRDLEFHSFGSETDSETPFSLKSVPSPIPRRDLDRESRRFGSETREPGISVLDTSHSEHFPMSHAFTYLFAILQNANASCHANCACHHGAILMNTKSLTPKNQRPSTQDCLRMYCLLR